jgi:EAL domain-containing protein (putative c-di-GMP-specific phosphodiesterase class I)
MRLHSVSLYNHEGDCLWLSEGALGPDEHSLVVEALDALTSDKTLPSYELGMEDGRIALFLAIRAPRGDLVGAVMILADIKSMSDATADRIVTAQVRTILQKIAVLLHKLNPKSGVTGQSIAMPGDSQPPPLTAVSKASGGPPGKSAPAQLGSSQIDDMLTLELVETPAPKPPAGSGARGKAPVPPVATKAPDSARRAPAGAKAPTAAKGAPATAVAPATRPPEIEVLAFEPDVPLAQARPAPPATPVPASDVLAFDANIQIPTARAAAAPPPDIEVLSFEAEPPVVSATPAPRPAAESKKSATAKAATAATPRNAGKASKAAADEKPMLIQDTGPFPQLRVPEPDATAIAPASALPPPEPLSVADTAGDLVLHVQELIKLRSSGRTRRYEVLARSQRDAGRNEVPPAFIAEAAKGSEGAELDALVVERLLKWLGRHGEEIWDSEPASFSVNLSIGALEDATFTDRIGQWLRETNVPPEHIGFEITEFACVQCRPQVQRFAAACETLGCFLVIDNFTFDSDVFELLGSKALRHVKIDAKITTAAMKDKLPQALVVAILQACKVLGVHCVAKRIESQSTLQWLTAVGCDFAQGFALEKPTSLESLVSGKAIPALRSS